MRDSNLKFGLVTTRGVIEFKVIDCSSKQKTIKAKIGDKNHKWTRNNHINLRYYTSRLDF